MYLCVRTFIVHFVWGEKIGATSGRKLRRELAWKIRTRGGASRPIDQEPPRFPQVEARLSP